MEYVSGGILAGNAPVEGYLSMEDGIIMDIAEGPCPEPSSATGLIIPRMVNAHTHCADGAVRISPNMSIEELVAPPNGLKHRYLSTATDEDLKSSMREFHNKTRRYGCETFIDFREGGIRGCRLLRDTVPGAIILGRPTSPEFDEAEVESILDIADGIGLSSISDIDRGYADSIADVVRRRGKIFAIHASERVREDIDTILSLDPSFVVHMTEATDSDMLKCAETEVGVVVCTRSNMYFGKVPPIGRMRMCGMDIAIGTDNAMLCEPDMRSEARAFMTAAMEQGLEPDSVWGPMVMNGRKIINKHNTLNLKVGGKAEITVLPYIGKMSAENILSCKEPILNYY